MGRLERTKSQLQASILSLVTILFLSLSVSASEAVDTSSTEGKFNAGELIIHHVLDAHEIHIVDGLSIPLPMILFTENGMDVFNYSVFLNEGHEPTQHYTSNATGNVYAYHHGHPMIIGDDGEELAHVGWGINEHSFLDMSITKNVVGLLLSLGLMLWMFLSVAKAYKSNNNGAPRGFQSFVEPLILFVRDEIAKPSIGNNHNRYMPFLLTVFFFIWIGNLLGLVPFLGGLNVTGNIAVTAVLAVFTFLITSVIANKGYWKHMVAPPGVPVWLLPIIVPIEIFGMFNKPIVLCLRLFANITAGHIIILSFTCLIFIFNDLSGPGTAYGVSVGTVLFSIFMTCLELLVAFLQAYVFTLLSALYFGQAIEDHH
jgi:F-type H+-transporting ATPase subunit a